MTSYVVVKTKFVLVTYTENQKTQSRAKILLLSISMGTHANLVNEESC